MIESLPGLLLVAMIAITLVLLPYLHDDRSASATRTTEEIRINVKPRRES